MPKTLESLERLLRIALLVLLLRMLQPGLSAVPLGSLGGLVSGAVVVRRRGRGLKRALPLPSSEVRQDEAVEQALQLVTQEPTPPRLTGLLLPRELNLPGPGFPGQLDIVDFLRGEANARGFQLEDLFEPAKPSRIQRLKNVVPRSIPVPSERTRELLCAGAIPFLAPHAFAPNPFIAGGARIAMAICGLEIIDRGE